MKPKMATAGLGTKVPGRGGLKSFIEPAQGDDSGTFGSVHARCREPRSWAEVIDDMARKAVSERDIERAMAFRQCPQCDYDFATHAGTRGCDLYACPYLPEALDTSCPNCNYNFVSGEGRPECSDPPS